MTIELWNEIGIGLLETLYMSAAATALSYVVGLPIGAVLAVTDSGGICRNALVNKIVGIIVNVFRSVPFLILFVALIPVTRAIAGTTIGASATIVPLVFAASPFVARLVESSLKETDGGVIEAAAAMGASPLRIVCRVMLSEALPSLLTGVAISFVTILGYSAMAGFCGGGGLGAVAVNYGYYRNNTPVMLITVAIIVVIVQVVQEVGLKVANRSTSSRKKINLNKKNKKTEIK